MPSGSGREGLKGVGAKVVILEEASRLDEAVFTEVIVPLLNVRDTAMLAISTPLDENNYYSTLLKMRDPTTGDPMFHVLEIKLICDVCAAAGITDVCPHRRELIPPWKTDHRRENMTRALFEAQPRMYMQEQLGIPSGTDARCFDTKAIDRFAARRRACPRPIGDVFVSVDTCGGGSNMMALISGHLTTNGAEHVTVRIFSLSRSHAIRHCIARLCIRITRDSSSHVARERQTPEIKSIGVENETFETNRAYKRYRYEY